MSCLCILYTHSHVYMLQALVIYVMYIFSGSGGIEPLCFYVHLQIRIAYMEWSSQSLLSLISCNLVVDSERKFLLMPLLGLFSCTSFCHITAKCGVLRTVSHVKLFSLVPEKSE